MQRAIDIGSYSADTGLHLVWSSGFEIEVRVSATVPAGAHVQPSEHDALEPGSHELVLERA